MGSQRNLFVIALLFVSFLLWQEWQHDHTVKLVEQKKNTISTPLYDQKKINPTNRNQNYLITVKTDTLLLKINTYGGDVEQAFLLSYHDKLSSLQPFHLLETSEKFIYQAQSGLIEQNGSIFLPDKKRPLFFSKKSFFTLEKDQSELRVPMTYIASNGVIYTKTFILKRGDFALDVDHDIKNFSTQPLEIALFGQLKQSIDLPKSRDTDINHFSLHSYRGAAYSTTEYKYKKYSFKDIQNKNLSVTSNTGGWIAMLQQYFTTAWVPSTKGRNVFYATNLGSGQVAVGFTSTPVIIKSGEQGNLKATLWIGPAIQEKMANIAPHLDLTVDYGWLWFISQPLFKLLKFIHKYIGNWGFSIIVITFIVRGIMYPLTKAQYTAMAKMRILQPKIAAIRERLGDNKQRQSQEMMALYKEEQVNPLGGCLPLLIQMPIFLALYYMLSGSIELRHAPFILWLHDLSAKDPYYILPIMMGATMFFIQKTSPSTTTDPLQQKIITFMPVIFTVFFLWFPSGLVLYYIVSNLVTMLQQQFIYRGLEKRGLYNREKRK